MLPLRPLALGLIALLPTVCTASPWPQGAVSAVSLSYDDTLESQLDYALPALNQYNLKGSFYLVLSAPALGSRFAEWKALPEQGHELGNHTLFHACSASAPDRDWVNDDHNLDTLSVNRLQEEVRTANTFLHAIDGQTQRTFTPPCNDVHARGGNYLAAIRDQFVAIKGHEADLVPDAIWLFPAQQTGAALIEMVQRNTRPGALINLTFHGIGGDYLSVSNEAHATLLKFLSENRSTYYVDTYLNILLTAQGANSKSTSIKSTSLESTSIESTSIESTSIESTP